jgi:hypothetical protein
MDADLSTLHAPEAAAEVVDEGCRRVRERGQIDIVRSATCVAKDDKRMAIRRTADIGGFCCKSLFAPPIKNFPGCRRGDRILMWGTTSSRD